ncbi:molybdate ABC transporter permease subunit [Desulfocurvibacter africanus]|uniref:ABC-type transporter, integral membrane subunit n=1 Tax=Desulfocurvibacter africanus subsp. africanus str. Walvis Bay TaxID=690850 RepID=F3Z234_DESAF|nr:ABC transporter permease subunit [Desulfocurvibacter africanus]EGJ51243.1 ABC-type transporter, integral membrane subunit [Desulfocurvibacter africanus subsp. africanus str. Walvis Bay]
MTMAGMLHALFDKACTGPLWLTARVTLMAAPLLLVLGVVIGYYLSRPRARLGGFLDFLVSLPLVLPPIATGFGLLMILGRQGLIGKPLGTWLGVEMIFSFWGVLVASIVAGLPLMIKPVQASVRGEVLRLMETSAVLGKSETVTFFRVVLPCIKKSVLAGLFLALGRSMGEVGVTLMLGGNILGRTNTVSLEIYNAVFSGEFERAAALSVLLGAIALGILSVLRRLASSAV